MLLRWSNCSLHDGPVRVLHVSHPLPILSDGSALRSVVDAVYTENES
jgi:hypothetical protein